MIWLHLNTEYMEVPVWEISQMPQENQELNE